MEPNDGKTMVVFMGDYRSIVFLVHGIGLPVKTKMSMNNS
jgi:hypothetical protein